MKYKVTYTATCAESSGVSSKIFEANDDNDARRKARALMTEMERSTNAEIRNRFWHYRYQITGLSQIEQEEIAHPVQIDT